MTATAYIFAVVMTVLIVWLVTHDRHYLFPHSSLLFASGTSQRHGPILRNTVIGIDNVAVGEMLSLYGFDTPLL